MTPHYVARMRTLLVSIVLLSGCPKGGGAGAPDALSPVFLAGQVGGPKLCVSPVLSSGRMKADDADVWARAVAALEARDVGRAASIAGQGSDHAGLEAIRGITSLLVGNYEVADTRYDLVLAEAPDDWCALMTGALIAAEMEDDATARERAQRAWELAPDQPEAGFLAALISAEDPAGFEAALEEILARHPDHGASHLLLYRLKADAGDTDAALDHLEAAVAAGLIPRDALMGPLLEAGRLGDVVKLASELGDPLGDGGALAQSEDPVRDYYALLGGTPEDTFTAVIETSMGDLTCELFPEAAPVTVANFVGLAKGTIDWVDPATGATRTGPLYDGVTFHRVIPEFMIQSGDPLGDGTGGPGYRFRDEVSSGLTFDGPGKLAMANAGPGTNGSQWFITEKATPHLNGRHTIFGQCDEATVEKVKEIARVETDGRNRPLVPVVVERIRIETE